MTLFCDNQAALRLVTANNYHAHTKHIDTHYHFIHQTIKDGSIILIYCPTDDMTADILTKALLHWKVATHVLGLRLHHASRGVLDSGTLGEAKAEADGVGSSAGGWIVCSVIVGQPVS
jgi:hypothetical protein